MTQDMEIKDNHTLQHLKEIAALVDMGSSTKEVRHITRAVRLTVALRKKLTSSVISSFLDFALVHGSKAHTHLSSFVPNGHEMDVDSSSSTSQAAELELYCCLLVLLFLIDQKKYNEAKACSSASIALLKTVNRTTTDVIASELYGYYSLSYEMTGDLAEIRGTLLNLYHSATLRHDQLGQETLLNLLLHNYLHYNMYDQAEALRTKAPRFDSHSQEQLCRYLFYLGKIQTVQLKYTAAKESLLQAATKAPFADLSFRVECSKWSIVARLLLAEIPEKSMFTQTGMENALRPYLELTNAVRIGDMEAFTNIQEKFAKTFSEDKTHNLIVRLRHNVIRTRLRSISISYSRISLADVAQKLKLNSANPIADVESIVAKAIKDGAIDAIIDHKNSYMISKQSGDIYSSNEPQTAFDSRIKFCLNMQNEAVRALRFPPNTPKEKEESNQQKREKKQQEEEELAKYIAEEDYNDF